MKKALVDTKPFFTALRAAESATHGNVAKSRITRVNASLRELNSKASELARRAQAGEVITITDRGRPIADLGPHRDGVRYCQKSDVVHTFRALAPVDAKQLCADLDAVVDPDFHDLFAR